MSQENVELLYRAEEAFNRRDLDAFLALLDPNVEFNSRIVELEGGGEPFSQRFTGTFSEDSKAIAGRWEIAEDGKWKTDFDLTYTRIE